MLCEPIEVVTQVCFILSEGRPDYKFFVKGGVYDVEAMTFFMHDPLECLSHSAWPERHSTT